MSINSILNNHRNLENKLLLIPTQREMTYREVELEGSLIGKPRFKPKRYKWPPDLLTSLRDHLQDIFDYFQVNSYWFDDELKLILMRDSRRLSKKSVIFLLERDVWRTDEVYGDYLIEEKNNETVICYYRFGQRFSTFTFPKYDKFKRNEWICADAEKQIREQFKNLWKRLEIELITCQEEVHNRPIPLKIDDDYLFNQYQVCKDLINITKGGALLMLGRLEELWILKNLKRTRTKRDEKLFNLAEQQNIIDNNNRKLFMEIRSNYNLFKHTTTYNIENCDIERLIKQFGQYLYKTKEKF